MIRMIHILRRKGWTDTEIIEYPLEGAGETPEGAQAQAS